jgi:hypothetical protein
VSGADCKGFFIGGNMENDMVNLRINEDLVTRIVEKQVIAAVMANIGDPEELIGAVVQKALQTKVDSDGNINSYDHNNRHNFMEYLVTKKVKEMAEKLLIEWLEDNNKVLKEILKKELDKKTNMNKLIKSYMNSFEESLACTWRFDANIVFTQEEPDYE